MTQRSRFKIGDKVRFTRDIVDYACGDHPTVTIALKGEVVTISRVDYWYHDVHYDYQISGSSIAGSFGVQEKEIELCTTP